MAGLLASFLIGAPLAALAAITVFALVLALSRLVSLASILGVAAMRSPSIAVWMRGHTATSSSSASAVAGSTRFARLTKRL